MAIPPRISPHSVILPSVILPSVIPSSVIPSSVIPPGANLLRAHATGRQTSPDSTASAQRAHSAGCFAC
jgi:hypothetical protein